MTMHSYYELVVYYIIIFIRARMHTYLIRAIIIIVKSGYSVYI